MPLINYGLGHIKGGSLNSWQYSTCTIAFAEHPLIKEQCIWSQVL